MAATFIHMLVVSQMRFHRRREPTRCVIKLPLSSLSREFRFSSPLRKVLFGHATQKDRKNASGGSLFAVAGATGGSGSRLRTSESFDPKHQNIDH
ncbi:hypothetical protein VNO80_06762 [Phaseolus coccineus]|uniref:Uncharacterized protein n=1 Tax=Phaseolus coccineus TaxID=3886 RepID=A0AAN9RHW3_PHACN